MITLKENFSYMIEDFTAAGRRTFSNATGEDGQKNVLFLAFVAVFSVAFIYLSTVRVDVHVQSYITVTIVVLLLILRRYKKNTFLRFVFFTLSSFLVLRYFFWRLNYTLTYEDFFSFTAAVTLFLAETYGMVMFFLSAFVNISPLERKSAPLPFDTSLWPSVDVMIPSYDEPLELVKITLASAVSIDYPADKLNVYLLDDGGTQQKLSDPDDEKRLIAEQRVKEFTQLCNDLGATYLSREKNYNAKAGNMNAALDHLSGDLILVLDADHAASDEILLKTVGSFIQDEKVFLVQTPHFFINPDPIEKNLKLFQKMPSENMMFYRSIQKGLDFWEASFFCGSAAVLNRKAIDAVGGFKGITITEDSETALQLHSLGWKSHYIFCPLISGLQPETFDSFMIQRMRWAQGMVQNFILNNPFRMPNLRIWQRLSYLSNMLFWFFPFARVVFLIAPGLYLCFGLKIYDANTTEFFTYTIPYMIALLFSSHYLFSRDRWLFVSEIYETLQSLFSIKAVWAVIRNPHDPEFAVTPKMETLEKDFVSPLSGPFYWAIGFTFMALVVGFTKYWIFPEERSMLGITLFWASLNFMILLAALGALYELKQRRASPRIPVNFTASWVIRSAEGVIKRIPVIIRDISMGGGNLSSDKHLPQPSGDEIAQIEIFNESSKVIEYFTASVRNVFSRDGKAVSGIKFEMNTINEYVALVGFVHGDRSRWMFILDNTTTDPGFIRSMYLMAKLGIVYGLTHLRISIFSFFSFPLFKKS